MPTLTVCTNCANQCGKCGSSEHINHGMWVCMGCMSKFNSKCFVCGKPKKGEKAGKICDRCFKQNKCVNCGEHV